MSPSAEAKVRVITPALVAMCLAYFMVILDNTIVNVALPALHHDLGASVTGLQWVVDGYLVMLAAGLLTGGALADRFGARLVFQVGLGVFVLASLGCGLAPNTTVLVIARLVQGVGAALSVPASLALLRVAFPDSSARARAIGIWGGIAGLAAATGPILGGVLVSAVSWRLVFFVNVPIGVAAMWLTAVRVPVAQGRPGRLDPAAQVIGVLALAALAFALIEGGHDGLTGPVLGAAALFVVAAVAFVLVERRVVEPMVPLRLFRHPGFSGGSVVGLLINLGFYGELFVLNLYFQQVLHFSALLAGVALLPQMAVVAAGSALSGRFTARGGGPRATMLIGLVVGGLGLLGLVLAQPNGGYPLLVLPLIAAGFGMSFTMPAATTAVVESAPDGRAGLASGVVNAARQVGGVVGIALLGALVSGTGAAFVSGLRAAMVLAGAAFLLGAVVTAFTIHRTTVNP
ncbi:MAG TPA: MFS transporter [Pseudonocardiaceae bacterium]|jgi:DHA2 family methylenomycin A resistance protein-like MFS transporter